MFGAHTVEMAKRRIIVVGGGAAGLMAAGQAAEAGAEVTLVEKMPRPGRKLCITGKGRCNITNVADRSDFVSHFGETSSFLKHPFACYFSPELIEFFESKGLKLVTERGGRVFPASGRAHDVYEVFRSWLKELDVDIVCSSPVVELLVEGGKVRGVVASGQEILADKVILAVGGHTYPRTGSEGDGYPLAESAGHTIVNPRPALVPLETEGNTAARMTGLQLRNVRADLLIDGEEVCSDFGELAFTDFGVTGPTILTLSGLAVDALDAGSNVELRIDLKPALTTEKLNARLMRDVEARGEESIGSVLRGLLPKEMVQPCVEANGVRVSMYAWKLLAKQRSQLVAWMKEFRLQVSGYRSLDEAIVTAGGVNTEEVDPKSMESTKCKGLYIVGELLDVHADTGGYNLQAAFTTGWMAGRHAAGRTIETQYINEQVEAHDAGAKGPCGEARFLPTTMEEARERGWDALDVILVTGDTYIDSPFIGVSVIGRVLEDEGYRVGIIAQPDMASGEDIKRLGEPVLFWGITAGCIDSLVANRTASGKKRRQDDYTPGGENERRPDRATIIYSNHIKQHFKGTVPLVLGGIEASLRRVAHYDFWTDKIRKSVLFDAKADYLLYGMAERAVVELADCLKEKKAPCDVRGLCYIAKEKPDDAIELPPFQDVSKDKDLFTKMFHAFYANNDPVTAKRLAQRQDTRYLVQNAPAEYLSTDDLDRIYNFDYARDVHPRYAKDGHVRALDTIRFSVATHRGCYGECNFCAIAVHQGRTVRSRSRQSIVNEVKAIAKHPMFKGAIQDVGGPTANMYGIDCSRKGSKGCCDDKRCLYPQVCSALKVNHSEQINLLKELRAIPGVKRIVVASGIRHDMVLADKALGNDYLKQIVSHHVSGQLKLAPEHSESGVLARMGKPGTESLLAFRELFYKLTKQVEKNQFLTYYMIAAHPGCTDADMAALRVFAVQKLQLKPEQVQVFTPTPSTYSTLMYWTEKDPFTGEACFVEKSVKGRDAQKAALLR